LFISFIEYSTLEVLKFLNTKISVSAPALSKAFFVSYSQFVPGKTGINTFGLAIDVDDFILVLP